MRSLKRALQPAITDVSVLFQLPNGYEVLQSPQNLPPIFNGEKLVVYGVLKGKAASKKITECTVRLRGNTLGAKVEHKVPFILDSSTAAPCLPIIHHLAAKALITDLESEQKEKKSIVDLSIESCVISSHTAFITIDEESSEPISGAMKIYDTSARWCGSNSSSFYDAIFYHMVRDCKDDEKEEMEGGLAEAVRSGVEKMRSVPNMRCARYDADADEKPMMMDELCEAELEHELASWSEGEGQERVLKQRLEKDKEQAAADTKLGLTNLTQIITAQQLNGSWTLDGSLAQLIGKSLSDLESACPIDRKGVGATMWATVLAVS